MVYWTAEGRAVGFATAYRLQRFDADTAEVLLYQIGVHEDFRKRGIAKALMAAVNRWALEIGAGESWVLTEAANDAARALYKAVGAAEEQIGIVMYTYKIGRLS